jgi:hypothetical protein
MSGPLLNPSTPLGFLELLVRGRIDRARIRTIDDPRDLGASVVEWVIISALVVGIAVAVGTALRGKLTDEVNNLNVGDQTGP